MSLFLRSRSVYEKQTVTLWLENMKQSGDNIIIKIHEGEMSLSLLLWLKKPKNKHFRKLLVTFCLCYTFLCRLSYLQVNKEVLLRINRF